jgi:hypothetical protein
LEIVGLEIENGIFVFVIEQLLVIFSPAGRTQIALFPFWRPLPLSDPKCGHTSHKTILRALDSIRSLHEDYSFSMRQATAKKFSCLPAPAQRL